MTWPEANAGAQSGFTLLEALIATAVLSLISLLLAPALLGAMDAAARNHALTDRIEQDAALSAVIHDLFAHTHQGPGTGDGMEFSGFSEGASFVIRPAHDGLQRADLRFEDGALVLHLTQLEPVGTPGSRTATLAEGFEGGEFTYVGLDPTDWRPIDVREWIEPTPPRLVILRLDWPDGTQSRIQALVAGEGRFECRFDSGRGLCLGDRY